MADTPAAPAFPMERDARCPFDPPPPLLDLQRSEPISRVRIWNGSEPWLVTRHEDIRAVLSHPAISSDTDNPGYPHQSAAIQARRKRAKSFFTSDGPVEHDEPRRVLARDFTARRMQALREHIQGITDKLIDDMLAGPKPVDLVEAFALPVPSLMICELLGVPYAEQDSFHRLTKAFVDRASTPEDTVAATDQLLDLLGGLLDQKVTQPADDLLSRLAQDQLKPGIRSRDELAKMALLLLTAGHETSANMIALGTAALLTHPEQLEKVRASDDPELIASTVEELLRYLTVVHSGLRRVAGADMEIGGQLIREGEGIICAIDTANRDAAAFVTDGTLPADDLDVTRPARHHLAFSFGVHQCLGQQLARVELQVVFSTLFRRIPTLALAQPLDETDFKDDMSIYGAHSLLVTW
ncbi:cytochrome P450 [Streptomyces sp. MSC1_001]|jgi:cytochrome P450|uniref:cytochrome P450 n=1 Tax=Streptomyces sp. MSC1_001 TaxID=2909263 RepID=UPI00202F6CFE|nr:cytochrome P450 [Streptomyces sp. MSC1_001]